MDELLHSPGLCHYDDVIMDMIASQITSLAIVYSTVYSGTDQRKHQSSASLAFVRGIHRGPVNSPHKWPVTRKMFPFDDVIMVDVIIYPVYLSDVFTRYNPYHSEGCYTQQYVMSAESILQEVFHVDVSCILGIVRQLRSPARTILL